MLSSERHLRMELYCTFTSTTRDILWYIWNLDRWSSNFLAVSKLCYLVKLMLLSIMDLKWALIWGIFYLHWIIFSITIYNKSVNSVYLITGQICNLRYKDIFLPQFSLRCQWRKRKMFCQTVGQRHYGCDRRTNTATTRNGTEICQSVHRRHSINIFSLFPAYTYGFHWLYGFSKGIFFYIYKDIIIQNIKI